MNDIFSMVLLVCLSLLAVASLASAQISCRNEDGEPVDWFVIYKLPKGTKSEDTLIKQGLTYTYLDSNNPVWKRGGSINETNAFSHTMQQFYDNINSENVAHVIYNDQKPDHMGSDSQKYGHTKGDIVFDHDQGFWIVHSVPRFPQNYESYVYPDNGVNNAQSIMCLTIGYRYLDVIGTQLYYNRPQVMKYNLPGQFRTQNPVLAEVVFHEKYVRQDPYVSVKYMETVGGQTLTNFAKYNKFAADLYDSLIATTFKTSLLVQTWRNGGKDTMDSNCTSKYTVHNVEEIELEGFTWTETKDHSKWAVSTSPDRYWVCIGGVNRMPSQMLRGGGAMCMDHTSLWASFKNTIVSLESCKEE